MSLVNKSDLCYKGSSFQESKFGKKKTLMVGVFNTQKNNDM